MVDWLLQRFFFFFPLTHLGSLWILKSTHKVFISITHLFKKSKLCFILFQIEAYNWHFCLKKKTWERKVDINQDLFVSAHTTFACVWNSEVLVCITFIFILSRANMDFKIYLFSAYRWRHIHALDLPNCTFYLFFF